MPENGKLRGNSDGGDTAQFTVNQNLMIPLAMPMEKIIQQLDEGLPDLHEAKIVQSIGHVSLQ